MKDLIATALRYQNQQLWVLDQQKLPSHEHWNLCNSPEEMSEMIRALQVRGAPLIGIAAALALANYAVMGASNNEIQSAAKMLKNSRPTAVNLVHCIDRQLQALDNTADTNSIIAVAEELFKEDAELCSNIARHGSSILEDGDNVLTHCNTGSLVTTGAGTALGIITTAHQQAKNIHVYVDETRPLLQGGRLTTWELKQAQVPYTLICDNMAAFLMQQGKIQKIIVGADRIARNGDFANKIGTYNLAVLAHYHQIPFYVAAPYTTIDPHCLSGEMIIIEEREAHEVRGAAGSFGKVTWSTADSPVYNPAFDVTPASLITAYILDSGIFPSLNAFFVT